MGAINLNIINRDYFQIPGAQLNSADAAQDPFVIGSPDPTGSGTGRICGRVFSAATTTTNDVAYADATQESVCSQRVSQPSVHCHLIGVLLCILGIIS